MAKTTSTAMTMATSTEMIMGTIMPAAKQGKGSTLQGGRENRVVGVSHGRFAVR